MGTNTTKLGLLKPSENDFYNQQTEQADNWDKVDKFADDIQNLVDNNSGKKITGYIQDSGEKILGNYYLDKLATGLFKCIKSGNINYNSSEYFENDSNYALSDKLKNLTIFVTKNVKLSKTSQTSTEYTCYQGAYTADVIPGYRVLSVMVADDANCVIEGVNFSHTSNRGFVYGFRVKSPSYPGEVEFELYLTYIKI